jgi:hypothetical protein
VKVTLKVVVEPDEDMGWSHPILVREYLEDVIRDSGMDNGASVTITVEHVEEG